MESLTDISITDDLQQFNDFITYCRQGKFKNAETVLHSLAKSVEESGSGYNVHKLVAITLLTENNSPSINMTLNEHNSFSETKKNRLDTKSITKITIIQKTNQMIKDLTEKGNAIAQNYTGLWLLSRQCSHKTFKEAMNMFKLSSDQGYIKAHYNLANCYMFNKNVFTVNQSSPQSYVYTTLSNETTATFYDQKKAVRHYTIAANQGHSDAQFRLGECYEKGMGVVADKKEALRWFHMSADIGNSYAQIRLADHYRLENNMSEAFRLYKASAEKGVATAQFRLARCYEKGEGVEKNLKYAELWYRRAAYQGHSISKYFLKQRNRMVQYNCCTVM